MTVSEVINVFDTVSHAFVNHLFVSAKSGSGKTNAMNFFVENQFLKFNTCLIDRVPSKKKILIIDNSGRHENATFSLPENDPSLIIAMNQHPDLVNSWDLRPQAFPDDALYFCGRGLLAYNRLPKNIRVISFREDQLSWKYLRIILGDTEKLKETLDMIQAIHGNDITMMDVSEIVFKSTFRGEKSRVSIKPTQLHMMKNHLTSLYQSGLFNDKVERFDLIKCFKDFSHISCFNTYFLEDDQEVEIAVSLVLDHLLQSVRRGMLDHRVLLMLPEVSDYMDYRLCADNILQILRKGRLLGSYGIDLLSDTQRAQDLKPKFRRQMGYHVQMKTDAKSAEVLLEVQYIDNKYLLKIPHYSVGQALVATGQDWHQPIQVPPCRHKHVVPGMNVFDELAAVHGWAVFDSEKVFSFDVVVEVKPDVVVDNVMGDVYG